MKLTIKVEAETYSDLVRHARILLIQMDEARSIFAKDGSLMPRKYTVANATAELSKSLLIAK